MDIDVRIAVAFARRARPEKVIEEGKPLNDERSHALWFRGRDWREITWENWFHHGDALRVFLPEAFVYYLPGVLTQSLARPKEWFAPVAFILHMLDRSPIVSEWDAFLRARMVGLQKNEYDALKDWLLQVSLESVYGKEVLRSFDTINLLQRETDNLRRAIAVGKLRS